MSIEKWLNTCIASYLLVLPVVATAQSQQGDPAAESGNNVLDEVVVTAQRREQNLQDVPISVSAITAASLGEFQITDTVQIQQLVPGLTINKNLLNATPFLRGVGQAGGSFGVDSPVAGYIDGFYLASPTASVFSLNNVSRVEVLKGPQGTLFGRNATGGVIQIVTKNPSDAPALDATAGYERFDTTTFNLYGETPITDNLAVNVSGLYRDQGDGWGTNVFTGNDAFYTDERAATAKLMWTPSDKITVKLLGFYDKLHSDVGINFNVYPGAVASDGSRSLGRYTVNHIDSPIRNQQYLVGLTYEQDLGWGRLVSLTGYQHLDNSFNFNVNGIIGSGPPPRAAVNGGIDATTQTRTQELQLLSPADSPVDWIAGVFYLDDQQSAVQWTCVGLAVSCGSASAPTAGRLQVVQDTRSYAAFGQTTFDAFLGTRLTLGLRYTDDNKRLSGSQPGATVPYPGAPYASDPNGIPTDLTWTKLTWRAALDRKFTDDVLGYVSYNRGFRSGSFNMFNWSNPPARPEVLDAYEIGLKTEWFDHALRLNSALFYYDYQDIQLRSAAPPAPLGTFLTLNAAQSEIYGLDVDFVAAPTDRLNLQGGFEVLHAEYTNFPNGPCSTPATIGGAVLGGTVSSVCPDLSGRDLIRAPHFTGTLGMTYRMPTSAGEFSLSVNNSYNSGFSWDPDNRLKQKAYNALNATLGWQLNDRWRFELWGRNLLDEEVDASVQGAAGGTDVQSPGEPRVYGVRVNLHLGSDRLP